MVPPINQADDYTPREVIDEIRKGYRVGETIDDSDPYREIARSAVPLVTDELYQSSTHFFYELLQNADDNDYLPNVTPELVIELHEDRIEILNNEVGFQAEHVRGICSLAKSTKRHRKESATGEKGIGFKAVFQATDTPEVHSNGYHFRFDKKQDPDFGMVIPEWLEGATHRGPGTRIVLPLNTEYRLPHDFPESLQPELLLFLRKIRRLSFRDCAVNREVTIARTDTCAIAVITRTVTDEVERSRSSEHKFNFFLHKLRVPMDQIDELRRPQIAATEVAIALPLNSHHEVDAKFSRGRVFAFLPVKTTGLPFLMHGDLVLSTSRETIREDLDWNQAVRNALGTCLADCIAACRATAIGATALRALVDPSGIPDEFLRPIMSDAIDRLKETPCVPLADGNWAHPSASIAADAADLWRLLESGEWAALLDKHLVDTEVDGIDAALRLLDVDSVGLGDLAKCLQNDSWRSSRDPAWWASCYSTLGRLARWGDQERVLLQSTPLFPLTSGNVEARRETMIFRRLSTKGTYRFDSALSILDPRVLEACPESQIEQVERFLQQMNVHDATPARVIDDYLVPLYRGDDWKALDDTTRAAHLLYVRDHLDQYRAAKGKAETQARGTLQTCLRIKSTAPAADPSHYARADALYLGRAYNDPHDLESVLDGIEGSRISRDYLALGSLDDEVKSRLMWKQLFVWLGAMERPRVYDASGTDYVWPEEVLRVLNDTGSDRQWRLLQLLDSLWSHYCEKAMRPGQGQRRSTLLSTLRDAKVSVGEHHVPLCTCFQDNDDNRAVFGESVSFVQCAWSEAFCDAVGVTHRPTVHKALDRLQSLKAAGNTERSAAEPIYKFLDSRFTQHSQEITTRLEDETLILAHHGDELAWRAVSQVRWSVPKRLRGYASPGSLSTLWRDFQGFFVERIGVDRELVAEDLVDVLEVLAEAKEDSDTCRKAVASIYRDLATLARSLGDESRPEWLDQLRSGSLLYTTQDEWWRNNDDVFVDDDPVLTQLFKADASVAFLAVSSDSVTQLRPLLDALGIRTLTEASDRVVPEDIVAEAWSDFNARWRERYRLFVRLLHHKYPDKCEKAFNEGTLVALRGMDAQVCRPLEVSVTLREVVVRHALRATITSEEGRRTLFVDEQCKADWTPIGIVIGETVGLSDSESLAIGQILSESLDGAQRLLDTLRVAELPDQLREALFDERVDDWLKDSAEHDGDGMAVGCEAASATSIGATDTRGDDDSEAGSGYEEPSVTHTQSYDLDDRPSTSSAQQLSGDGLTAEDEDPQRTQAESVSGDRPDGSDRAKSMGTGSLNGALASRQWSSQDRDVEVGPAQPPHDGSSSGALHADEPDITVRGHARTRLGGKGSPRDWHRLFNTSESGTGPPITPKSPRTANELDRSGGGDNRERLRSYVELQEAAQHHGEHAERTEAIKAIESAAIEYVLEQEQRLGRVVRDLNLDSQDNRGHDLVSYRPDGTDERYIEVKGIAGAWGQRGVMVTPAQFEFALQHGDKAWLYVVELALSGPRLHRIQDFARRVWRFGFDEGWADAAEGVSERAQQKVRDALPTPIAGMHVVLDDGRRGVVDEVKGAGRLLGVLIRLESGESVQKRWVSDEIQAFTGGS